MSNLPGVFRAGLRSRYMIASHEANRTAEIDSSSCLASSMLWVVYLVGNVK
jgi:hypothetical protein